MIKRLWVWFPVRPLLSYLGQLSLPSPRGRYIEYRPGWLGLRWGVLTCVGWQVTLCDPICQVMPCSSEMGSHKDLYAPYTLSKWIHIINYVTSTVRRLLTILPVLLSFLFNQPISVELLQVWPGELLVTVEAGLFGGKKARYAYQQNALGLVNSYIKEHSQSCWTAFRCYHYAAVSDIFQNLFIWQALVWLCS